MEIKITLTDRKIDTLLSVIESQSVHAHRQAVEGKRNWDKTVEYRKRLLDLSRILYYALVNAHNTEK